MKVALVSLEPWNEVWRRNQHLASELLAQGLVDDLVFVEPMVRRPGPDLTRTPEPGVLVVQPRTPVPRSLGGLRITGRRIARRFLRDIDVLWVNDPSLGVHCLRVGTPTVYDVTDDWRMAGFPRRIVRRIVAAEDRLAGSARTVVCSTVLQERWQARYGFRPSVVHNGVDARLWQDAQPRSVPGAAPHVGYIGTLHEHRLDVALVEALAAAPEVGSVHLVGPNHLPGEVIARLERTPGVRLHGPVPAADVPSWMLAMDVLVSPHRISPFTLSLDAIKAYEYAVAGRPVVATPTSGFTSGAGTTLAAPAGFVDACRQACREVAASPRTTPPADLDALSWAGRAREFRAVLRPPASATIEESSHA